MDTTPFRLERVDRGVNVTFDLTAVKGERQQKQALFGRFELLCDEGPELGGDDSAPPPLAFFAASLGFCLLTQITRVAQARKVSVERASVTVTPTFQMHGSILRGDAEHRLGDLQTRVDIVSDASEDAIAALLDEADRLCFVTDAIVNAHPVRREVTLNGQVLRAAG